VGAGERERETERVCVRERESERASERENARETGVWGPVELALAF